MNRILKMLTVFLAVLNIIVPSAMAGSLLTEKGYKLEQVVIFSRHNIRSPLFGKGSVSSKVTPHKWYRWTSPKGELSRHGAIAETIMGQYFREYLEDEHFIPANWQPEEGQVRFYANSLQRTVATARYFSSGMLPAADVKVERHRELNRIDPVFLPHYSEAEARQQERHLRDYDAATGSLSSMLEAADADFASLEKILEFKDSAYAREKGSEHFNRTDLKLYLQLTDGQPLYFKGAMLDAIVVSDVLKMQYYEEPDNVRAAFGNRKVTQQDWERVAHIWDSWLALNFRSEISSLSQSGRLLAELQTEFQQAGRKFSFLCGHDVNISCILTALGAEEFSLPGTIARQTPMGGKIVMEKRLGKDGREYFNVSLIYQTDDQLRNNKALNLTTPPGIYPLKFKSLTANEDGLYPAEDFLNLLAGAVARYKELAGNRLN